MARIEEAALHDRLEWDTPLFRTALRQYELALPYAVVSEGVTERLRYPERAVMLSVLVGAIREVAAALDARGLYP